MIKRKNKKRRNSFASYDFWQRYEIVLKREKATDFINKLKTGVDFAELYLKVLAGLIRFVDRGADKNKARWKTSEFWNTFIKNSEGVKLESKNLDPSLDKTIKWIDESVLTSLQLLIEVAKKEIRSLRTFERLVE